MQAMGLKSPAPIQSRLKHLQEKGYIFWQEGKARTLQLVNDLEDNTVPILGSIAAGGLIESYSDVYENLDKLKEFASSQFDGAPVKTIICASVPFGV